MTGRRRFQCEGMKDGHYCDRPPGHAGQCEALVYDRHSKHPQLLRWSDREAAQYHLRVWRDHTDEAYGVG